MEKERAVFEDADFNIVVLVRVWTINPEIAG